MTLSLAAPAPLTRRVKAATARAYSVGAGLELGGVAWTAYELLSAAYQATRGAVTPATSLAEAIFADRVCDWVAGAPCVVCETSEPYCPRISRHALEQATYPLWTVGEAPTWHFHRLSLLRHPRGSASDLLHAAGY